MNRIDGFTVTAPKTPATMTQAQKKTSSRPLSIAMPQIKPAARNPL